MRSAGLVLVTAALAGRLVAAVTAGGMPAGQADPGAEVFSRLCTSCHDPERIMIARRSRDQWQDVVDNMVSRGLMATDDERFVVLDYLTRRHGRVFINRALSSEIVDVLGLSPADAGRIVDHRKANGPFADLDALAKVPGIDAARIREQADAVSF